MIRQIQAHTGLQLRVNLKIVVGTIIGVGILCLLLAPIVGSGVSENLWGVEPLTYVGAELLIAGLLVTTIYYVGRERARQRDGEGQGKADSNAQTGQQWSQLTQQYFQLFDHDLGRPMRRIAGKERELRAVLLSSGEDVNPGVKDLLDEIQRQTPNFRLMLSNVQVLVQLEVPESDLVHQPVEPVQVIRRIVDRYTPVAAEAGKEITWWADPGEFGLVSSDSSAIEHIVANIVDNAVHYASGHVEVKITKNPTHFFIRVWDDGPGIGAQYLQHLFDRGWTPEVARREEKTSSGLGLFIAHTLAVRSGGNLTVESVAEPDDGHHTEFLLSMPLAGP